MEHKLANTSGSKTLRISQSTGRLQSSGLKPNKVKAAHRAHSKDERCDSCSEIKDREQERKEPFSLEETSKEQNQFVRFP